MSEGIALPPVARHTLLPLAERIERLSTALPMIRSAVEGENDAVALQATLACLLFETFAQASFAGFYRRVRPTELAIGPYQGPMGCLRIELSRGVCGAAARTGHTQRVPDVEAFPGHIACDGDTKSELVVPVRCAGEVKAVLDLDSHVLDAWSTEETVLIEALLRDVFDRADVEW